jgi:murein DD-endopeptidase MepM/ murein hydrolase activator NlpD
MARKKKNVYYLTLIPLVIIVFLFLWLFTVIFEGEKPVVILVPLPDFISQKQQFSINISDAERGLRSLKVSYNQGGNEVTIYEETFPFQGLLNREGVHYFSKIIDFDPLELGLAQGRVDLNIQVWDYSRRGGGDGNMTLIQHKMTVDTIPPAVRAISRMHNINMGGAGLIIYRTSSDTIESGVYVDDDFFPGFPAEKDSKEGTYLAYFALRHDSSQDPSVYLWAKDRAENTTNATFNYNIRQKSFGTENMNINDRFLTKVLPYFSFYEMDPQYTDVEKYVKINNDLRLQDNETLYNLMKETAPEKYWEGAWLRLKNAATTADFADHRKYYYKGEEIDEQYHMGIDLASLANSPVEAANGGKVLFAERNGIYGLTVVLDHGQGLGSLYGHLSEIMVVKGDLVEKGGLIGYTGQTGLAGGDHLHFGMMVYDVFVNPIEWWDAHWIEDNVTIKLDLLKEE